jgi:hypothetical protein
MRAFVVWQDGWRSHLSKLKFEMMDVGNAVGFIMAVKEDSEINTIKKACQVVSFVTFCKLQKYKKFHSQNFLRT